MEKDILKDNFENAQQAFDKDDFTGCLRFLTFCFEENSGFRSGYELALQALIQLHAEEEINLFQNALNSFNEAKPFYDLGYHFIEVAHYRLSIPFLERALSFESQSSQTVLELSLAYTANFQVKEAFQILSSIDWKGDFWGLYQLHYCALLLGDSENIAAFIQSIREGVQKEDSQNETIQTILYMMKVLEEMLFRLEQIKSPQNHIRDWHFIQYGSAILDYFDEHEEYVAGGRYVSLWGTWESVASNLEKLKVYLEKLSILPKKILIWEDRSSEIIGMTLAKKMSLPIEKVKPENIEQPNSILIVSQAHLLNESFNLIPVQKNQIVFAYNLNWLHESLFTPDITSHLTQHFFFPWNGGGLHFNPETNNVTETEDDLRPVDLIVEEILKQEIKLDSTFDEVLAFYQKHKNFLKGSISGVERVRFKLDSPVKGSYFI